MYSVIILRIWSHISAYVPMFPIMHIIFLTHNKVNSTGMVCYGDVKINQIREK